MSRVNQSIATLNNTPLNQNVSSYATITQDDVDTPDEAIKKSLLNSTNAALTTSEYEPHGVMKTQPAFVDQGQVNKNLDPAKVVYIPKPRHHPASTFHALQEWEGYVTEINDTEFTANLIDISTGESYEKNEADIPIDEISEEDASKMQVGSIFRWVIGYELTVSGTKKRVSHIVFRNLPAVTKADLREGEEWARKIMEAFKPRKEPDQ